MVDGQGYIIAHRHMLKKIPKDQSKMPDILAQHLTEKLSIHMYIQILLLIVLCVRVHTCLLSCVYECLRAHMGACANNTFLTLCLDELVRKITIWLTVLFHVILTITFLVSNAC